MKKCLAAVLMICLIISLFPVTANANDSVLGGTGMTVFPIFDTDVVMEEEIIDILVKDGKTYVKCQFFFHNTGERTKLFVGFPTQAPGWFESQADFEDYYKDNGSYFYNYTKLNWFRTFVRGKRVPVKVKRGLVPEGNNKDELYFPQWYTWNITFGKNERVKVVNKYWMWNSFWGDSEGFDYILRSGATWKNKVGKITVRVKFDDSYFVNGCMDNVFFDGMPPTYIGEDNTVIWKAENIEPAEDISCYFETPYAWFGYPPFEPDTPEYVKYEKMTERFMRNYNKGYFNGATWWGDKFVSEFGDQQSDNFYYLMGISYYKKKSYTKALNMLNHYTEPNEWPYYKALYYKALIYDKLNDTQNYEDCLNQLIEYGPKRDNISWMELWAQSRLADMAEQET